MFRKYNFIFYILFIGFFLFTLTSNNIVTGKLSELTGFPKFVGDQNNIISKLDDLEKRNKLLLRRIDDYNRTNSFNENTTILSVKYLENSVSNCSNNYKFVNFYDLKINIPNEYVTIRFNDLEEIIGSNFSLNQILPYSESYNNRVDIYSNISISINDNEVNFKTKNFSKNLTPSFLDYVFYVSSKETNSINCKFILRVPFAEKFLSENSGWNIVNGFGRVGFGLAELSLPYGTEFKDELFWTTDCSNGNVSIFNKRGEFLRYFGSQGEQIGYLSTPADIKVADDKVYVIEETNHRVQVFSINGVPLKTFGEYTEEVKKNKLKTKLNKFNNPLGIALGDDQILIVDYGNNRVMSYDQEFNNIWVSDDSIWNGPYYAEYIPNKKSFVVVNRGSNNIVLINKSGEITQVFGEDILNFPHEIAVDENENLLVANYADHNVIIFDNQSNYNNYHSINFPESYGYIKTVSSIDKNNFLAGFVANGAAYFLHLRKKNEISSEFYSNNQLDFKKTKNNIHYANFNLSFDNYKNLCSSCHETGKFGAPQRGNIESWNKYKNKNIDDLTKLALIGEGSMLKKSGCENCNYFQMKELIKVMLPLNWKNSY